MVSRNERMSHLAHTSLVYNLIGLLGMSGNGGRKQRTEDEESISVMSPNVPAAACITGPGYCWPIRVSQASVGRSGGW